MAALLMGRRTAGAAVVVIVVLAVSFAVALDGRAASQSDAAELLPPVTVPERVGDLRKLPPAVLPKLAKTPEPETQAPPASGTPSEPDPPTTPPPSSDPPPSTDPPPAATPAPTPAPTTEPPPNGPGGGCDPCG